MVTDQAMSGDDGGRGRALIRDTAIARLHSPHQDACPSSLSEQERTVKENLFVCAFVLKMEIG